MSRLAKILGQKLMKQRLDFSFEQEKPQGHWTPPFFPSPWGAKYSRVTQGMSSSGVSL